MQESRFLPSTARRARMAVALAAACASVAVAAPSAFAGAVISNGVVALGVNDGGQLNFSDATRYVGVTYEPTGFDGTKDGCPCEGWGAGWTDGAGQHAAAADQSSGVYGFNQDSFTSTASTATSVTDIEGKLKITQDFKPAATTPNLYEIHVTLENVSGAALPDVRYTRLMDWDIEPTPFSEFVTIQGVSPKPDALLHSDDNGFSDPNPFSGRGELSPGTTNANVTDSGPADHGADFDFGFGTIDPGKKIEFSIFYGATADEATANAVVSAAALEIYSYGQSSGAGGPTLGTPTTFIWGFKAVGGKPVIPPTLALTPKTATNTVGDPHTVTAELKDSAGAPVPGAKLVFEVSGVNSPPKGTGTTDANGKATFTYTGTNPGDDTIKACLDNNDNGSCDPDEVTDTATKHWNAKAAPAPAIALTPKTATNTVGDPHTVTATVTDTNAGGAAINGAKVVFVVTGVNPQAAVSKTTDATGKTTDTWTGTNVGDDTVTACVDTSGNGACEAGEPTDTAAKTWVAKPPPADRTAPSCVLANTGTDATGKKYIEIAVQDTGSGLKSVVVNQTVNATTPVPPFAAGSTAKLTIRATKKDQSKSSTVELTVTDVAGNKTVCDPVIAKVRGGKRGAFVKTFRHVPAAEHWLRITNGKPGLRAIRVTVNGRTVLRGRLDSGERQKLDIAKYLRPGRRNTVVVRSRGGNDALVVISD